MAEGLSEMNEEFSPAISTFPSLHRPISKSSNESPLNLLHVAIIVRSRAVKP